MGTAGWLLIPMSVSVVHDCQEDRSSASVLPGYSLEPGYPDSGRGDSALGNESEYLVSQSLEKLAKGRTTITIAHRLTTIQGADRILVLSGSRIVEEGNHEDLLARKGMYYQLYTTANRLNQGIA